MPVAIKGESDTISVSLITGFLGSGKTTLLNHLLASPEMDRTAVLINEFGEVGLDHLIVREIDQGTVLLKSGCVCCTIQGELVDALKELHLKRLTGMLPPFTRVAIETTGLADPLPILTCLMLDPLFKHVYRPDGIVTTVDAVHGAAQLDRHPEAVRQAAVADRLIITKSDLVDKGAVTELHQRLSALNPGAMVIVAMHCRVTPRQLLNTGLFDARTKSVELQRWLNEEGYGHAGRRFHFHTSDDDAHAREHAAHEHIDVNRHDEHIAAFCLTLDEPLAWEAFRDWYEEFAEERGDHILRVKGIVNIIGSAEPFVIQCVRSTQHPLARLAAWPEEDRRSRIVFITDDLPREEVEASLRAHLAHVAGAAASKSVPSRTETEVVGGRSTGHWLNEAELSRIFGALTAQQDRVAADALRLMLLTGVSCDDVRTARWEEFDIDRRLWLKPEPGAPRSRRRSRPRRIPLGDAAIALLVGIRERGPVLGGIFGGTDSDIPMSRLASVWSEAAERAGVDDVALDALQPVVASGLLRGLSPALTRRLLGIEGAGEAEARERAVPE